MKFNYEYWFWMGVVYIYIRAIVDFFHETFLTREPYIPLKPKATIIGVKKSGTKRADGTIFVTDEDLDAMMNGSFSHVTQFERDYINEYMKHQALEDAIQSLPELEIIEEIKN